MSDIKEFMGPIEENPKVNEYANKLAEIRKDGVAKISDLRSRINLVKNDKYKTKGEKKAEINSYRDELKIASAYAKVHAAEEKKLEKEAVEYVNKSSVAYEKKVIEEQNKTIAICRAECKQKIAKIKKNLEVKKDTIKTRLSGSASEIKLELQTAEYEAQSAIFDAKSEASNVIARAKMVKNQLVVSRVQKNIALRNGRTSIRENREVKRSNYITNFKTKDFLLNNGLYIAIALFFIVCIIIAPITVGSRLLTIRNVLTILEQTSTRMFYALGVAGLILLGGTDLSIGRMVALGSVTTGLILHPGVNIVKFFNLGPWDFTALPIGVRLIMALFISVLLCVMFSCFSGMFTSKLKIHPFISTMSTQLIIYGILFYGTKGTPTGSIDSAIKDMIGGRIVLGGGITFPKLIFFEILACLVAWFIWNKTKFGKNMYAVGGNSEAAAVSGIDVVKTTLLVFVMAGIFYGCGSFLEAFRANASAGTGQGFETDAIAACVVGGISFSGGIGKITGAMIGVIIFTGLTYCLTFLGIDTNLQFVFKGAILILAVALDSVKYLKRK